MKKNAVTMKRSGRALAFSLLLTMAHPTIAQGPGWTEVGKVIRIVNTSNGGFNIRMSPELTGCTSQSNYGPNYASVLPSHSGLNRIKGDVLVAFTTGTDIRLYLTDSNCTVGEMVLGGTW
jgi:hypothetical protein